MPYKVEGNKVMVYRNGRWQLLHEHESHAKALAHLRALEINVEGHGTIPKSTRKPKPTGRSPRGGRAPRPRVRR